MALWEGGEMPGAINLAKLRDLLGDDLLEPTAPPSEAALAYWRGRVDQIAKATEAAMTQLLLQQRELSRDMGGSAASAVEPEVTTHVDPDEFQDPRTRRSARRGA